MHILKINLRRLDLVVINQDYLSFYNYSENIVFIIQKMDLSTTVAIITEKLQAWEKPQLVICIH